MSHFWDFFHPVLCLCVGVGVKIIKTMVECKLAKLVHFHLFTELFHIESQIVHYSNNTIQMCIDVLVYSKNNGWVIRHASE